MAKELIGNYELPTWVAAYLEKGEQGDICDEEVDQLARFLKRECHQKGYRGLVFDWGRKSEFNYWPEFGLPGPTIKVAISGKRTR